MTLKDIFKMLLPKRSVAQVIQSFTEQFEEIEQEQEGFVENKTQQIVKLQEERSKAQSELDQAKRAREWLTKGLTGN